MKTIKMNYLKTLVNISLALLLLTFSCGQSGDKTAQNVESETTIATPEIDIQTAILTNNLEAVKQHIDAGTDLNKKDAMTGSTPLITAASFGKNKIAQVLIDANADLSAKNNDGATALHTSAFFCRTEIVQMLLDANADTSLRNNFGATPRESVMVPFADMKPIYEMLQQQLQPMGLLFDLNEIEETRPIIASMLK